MKILSWQQACEEECTVILRIYIILMAERENQMKKFGLALIIFILLVFNGCGQISSFSGKYVNEQDMEPVKIGGALPVSQHILKSPEAASHMVEHAVQHHFYPRLMELFADFLKILVGAETLDRKSVV